MEGNSFKLFAPIVLVALIMVLSTTTVTSEEMPKMYVMEEVTMVEPKAANMVPNGNHKPKMMIMQVVDQSKDSSRATTTTTTSSGLSCSNEGEYCNTLFGNSCCDGIACVQAPFGGGVCHKW